MEVSGKKTEKEVQINQCEPCKDDNTTTTADGLCQECQEFMCQTCFKEHLKARICRNHVLVDPDQLQKSTEKDEYNMKCEKHSTESVRFYCRGHNATGCGDCMLLDHKQCAHEYIRVIAKDFPESSEFKQFKEKLDQSVVKVNDCLKVASSKKSLVAELEKTAVQKIKQFRTEVDSFLNKAEKELLERVKECTSQNNAFISKYEKEILSLKCETEEVKSQIDAVHGFALFKATVEHKGISDKVAEKIAVADSQTSLDVFDFVADTELQKLITISKSMGCIRQEKEKNEPRRSKYEFQKGDRVRRGKDWQWTDQDGKGIGTVIKVNVPRKSGWTLVLWDNGHQNEYRNGAEGCYDLEKI